MGVSTPETSCLTHINYAFGHVADDNKGIRIDNEPRLQMIVGLKKEKPSLKVLLSVGGWGSSRFSEMAANDSTRTAFAADCRRVIDKFGWTVLILTGSIRVVERPAYLFLLPIRRILLF